jgi:basic membrane lipoprotein Med (substrate-binding protein (PBP1-ABC) superfamily)
MIEQGADIVFQVAGLTGLGVINAAQEKGVLAIGVDVDQNNVAPDTVITSAEKKLVESTALVIENAVNGQFPGGTTAIFGINENSTGISDFHSFDSVVPQAVKDIINQTIADMKAGRSRSSRPVRRSDCNKYNRLDCIAGIAVLMYRSANPQKRNARPSAWRFYFGAGAFAPPPGGSGAPGGGF